MDTWYFAAALAIFIIVGWIVAIRERMKVKRAIAAKLRKEASKAKRASAKARKVGLALTLEQQARAEGMINSTGTQNVGNSDATWPWGNT